MFKTSAIFRMLSAFRLRIWPVAPALAPASAANDNQTAARPQGGPRPIHLEANIAFAVQAVMNEKLDLAKLRKQSRQPASA